MIAVQCRHDGEDRRCTRRTKDPSGLCFQHKLSEQPKHRADGPADPPPPYTAPAMDQAQYRRQVENAALHRFDRQLAAYRRVVIRQEHSYTLDELQAIVEFQVFRAADGIRYAAQFTRRKFEHRPTG